VSLEKYEYLQPHKTQVGNYQSICNYRLSKNELLPFYFETPKLKTTSGIVRIDNKFYIDLELPQSGDTSSFYQFLLKNDEQNITMCHENSKEWFSNTMPLNIVEGYYKTPILLKPNGQKPILRLHLPSYKGNILTEIYNIRKEKISDILAVQDGDNIVGIVEFAGLSFMSQKFSPVYELQKIKIFKDNDYRNIPSGYIFSDINDKIDLDNIPKNSNDKILEQSVEINKSDTLDKSKPKEIIEPEPRPSPNITKDNNTTNATNDDKKVSTLFEMIKNTSLKDIINDNDIFLNNTKFLIDAKQKREQIIQQMHNQQINNSVSAINNSNIVQVQVQVQDKNKIENKSPNGSSPVSPIAIQDVNEINLDIDYDLDLQKLPTENNATENNATENNINVENSNDNGDINIDDISESNDNISENELNAIDDNDDNDDDNDDDDNDDDDNISENELNDNELSSDDGIDYKILNDLEVVVFDE
jgi:hypothetical protein